MTAHPGPMPVPARITEALDARGFEGPWVDEALGGTEPMVDEWEAGNSLPTPAQVDRLAELTGFPPAFFYRPVEEWETVPRRTFLCQMGRRGDNGLTILRSWIDWDGVAHTVQETPDRPPYRPRKPKPARPVVADTPPDPGKPHAPQEDPDNGGCCLICRLPLDGPNWRHRGRKVQGQMGRQI